MIEIPTSRKLHVIQGEFHVSSDRDLMLSTVLGSCVSACMHDPDAGVGGMNHFLLAEGGGGRTEDAVRYGAYAMEMLINGLLKQGARRDRLTARLFGGARMVAGLSDVGADNARFAIDFLEAEGIPLSGYSLGGVSARRVEFWPASGRARQRLNVAEPPPPPVHRPPEPKILGDVELF
jgi:chemotaxis protein CheD